MAGTEEGLRVAGSACCKGKCREKRQSFSLDFWCRGASGSHRVARIAVNDPPVLLLEGGLGKVPQLLLLDGACRDGSQLAGAREAEGLNSALEFGAEAKDGERENPQQARASTY